MATVYFGCLHPLAAYTGDWTALNQWYSDQGSGAPDKLSSPTPGTYLGRLPTPADTIELWQSPTTNVTAWSGAIVCANGNGVIISSGTWSGAISGGLEISGGTFTNTCTITCNSLTVKGNPTFNQALNAGMLTIESGIVRIGTVSALIISGGTITSDISTAVTGGNFYEISGGTFSHVAPWVFGAITANAGAQLKLAGAGTYNRNITVYGQSRGSITANFTNFSGTISGRLSILPCDGIASVKALNGGSGTYSPPAIIIPVTLAGADTVLPMTNYPLDYGFKIAPCSFTPIVSLSGIPNPTDILGVLLP